MDQAPMDRAPMDQAPMDEARWHVAYPEDMAAEPIVWELAAKFGLVTTISRADVRDHVAWLILDVRGEIVQLELARAWLAKSGLQVSVLTVG